MSDPFGAARAAAFTRVAAIGLPTTAAEDWRYVDVKPLATPPATSTRAVTAAEVAPYRLPHSKVAVLVDGVPHPGLGDANAGVESLTALPEAEATALAQRWSEYATTANDITALWSLSDFAGGLRIRLRGVTESPLQIICIATGGSHGVRLVIEAARGAQADLVITHVALGAARSSVGIEADLADGAMVKVDEVHVGATAQLFPRCQARLDRDASLTWATVGQGGVCVRNAWDAALNGANAAISLSGLSLVAGTRQAHQHLRLAHQVGDTRSQQVFKTIADGKGIASFDGLVRMAHGADRADAEQSNHNLLLSAGARVDTRPQLDILADDVKASHGATVGQLDPEQVFYLRARGLPASSARGLLIHGFAQDLINRLCNPGARVLASTLVGDALGARP